MSIYTEKGLNKAFKSIDKRFEIKDMAKELQSDIGLDCFAIYYGDQDLAIFMDQPEHGYVLRFTMLTVPVCKFGQDIIDDCFKGIYNAKKEAHKNED